MIMKYKTNKTEYNFRYIKTLNKIKIKLEIIKCLITN